MATQNKGESLLKIMKNLDYKNPEAQTSFKTAQSDRVRTGLQASAV